MRKLLLSLVALCMAAVAGAQSTQRFIVLKNNHIVKGEITDSVPGETLTVVSKDGAQTVVNYEDILRVMAYSQELDYHPRAGLDYEAEGGYMQFTDKQGGGAPTASVIVGKRFSKNVFLGVGGGVILPDHQTLVPISVTGKYYFPLNAWRFEPFLSARVGYVINTKGDDHGYHYPDYFLFHIMPGVQIPINKRFDCNVSAGYSHLKPTKSDIFAKSVGILTVTVGITFHGK